MTRTEIAAMVLHGMASNPTVHCGGSWPNDFDEYVALVAMSAVTKADALLAELAKTSKPDTGEALLSSVLAKACQSLLDIIHDDMTHAQQRNHACAIQDAHAALDAARKAGAK